MNIDLKKPTPTSAFPAVVRRGAEVLCLSAITTCVYAASVESVSNDVLIHQGEDAFWQATVKCEGSSIDIPIKQARQQQDWCSENDDLPCAQSKLAMAQQVCLNIETFDSSRRAVAVPQPSPVRTERPTAAQQQQAEQRESQRRARAERLSAIQAEEEKLLEERRQLEAQRQRLEQQERELTTQERELEAQLRELEN